MSVTQLSIFLKNKGISQKDIDSLADNMVSGKALTLLDTSELKELIPTIGDRAQVREIIRSSKEESMNVDCDGFSVEECGSGEGTSLFNPSDDGEFDTSSTNDSDTCNSFSDENDLVVNNHLDQEFYTPPDKWRKVEKLPIVSTPTARSKKLQEDPLPRPFDVPRNFPPNILAALDSKTLVGAPRSKFITVVSQSIYRYKSYPTEEEYIHVTQQLLKQWPFLDEGKGLRYLVMAIRMRMAYLRKPSDRKRGDPTKQHLQPFKIQNKTMPYSPNLHSDFQVEDEASMKRHLKLLQMEFKKVVPNRQITKELMKRTYPKRRQEVLDGNVSIGKILEMYPAHADEVLLEFNRIMERNADKEILEIWDQLIPKILELAEKEGSRAVTTFLQTFGDIEVTDGFKSILAMCVLALMVPDARCKYDHIKVITMLNNTATVSEEASTVSTAQPSLILRQEDGVVKDTFPYCGEKSVM